MGLSKCRWGFLSTAHIGQRNWQALRHAENATLVAVASRDIRRSQRFIDRCQTDAPMEEPPQAIASYQDLLERDDIDAVYVPLPTGLRDSWVIRAAEAGKHVLCEKPCAVDANRLADMQTACRNNGVQFMDGVMFMHTKRLQHIRKMIDEKTVGPIQRITSHLCFRGDTDFQTNNIRVNRELEPHGCLGDLGWYNIRLALFAANWCLPHTVRATTLSATPDGVPTECSAELFFDSGISSSFYCSFLTNNQQWAVIGGEQGFIEIPDFVLPFSGDSLQYRLDQTNFNIVECEFEMQHLSTSHLSDEASHSAINAQDTNLFRNFSSIVLDNQVDAFWLEVAMKTQQVLDACSQSAAAGGKLAPVE